MDKHRKDCCILINSTPKYYSILILQVALLRRYAAKLKWRIFLATEKPDHEVCKRLVQEFGVELIVLTDEESGFLESRLTGVGKLPPEIFYVLPLQDDFILDREPMYDMLSEACNILDIDRNVASLRLTPCPGPAIQDPVYIPGKVWRILTDNDDMVFTYQATLWRRIDYYAFFKELLLGVKRDYPDAVTVEQKRHIALNVNCAEISYGQNLLKTLGGEIILHLAYPRVGPWSNAVYLCPFPYRPTAIVRGKLEDFAKELGKREGFPVVF
jgi:hypothetical protein